LEEYVLLLHKVEPDFNTSVDTSWGASLKLDYYIGLGTASNKIEHLHSKLS